MKDQGKVFIPAGQGNNSGMEPISVGTTSAKVWAISDVEPRKFGEMEWWRTFGRNRLGLKNAGPSDSGSAYLYAEWLLFQQGAMLAPMLREQLLKFSGQVFCF